MLHYLHRASEMRCTPATILLWLFCLVPSVRAQPSTVSTDIQPIDRDVIVVVIPERLRLPGQQVPYQSQPDDKVVGRDLIRDGKTVGWIVGRDRHLLQYYDSMIGAAIDPHRLDQDGTYRVTVDGTKVSAKVIGRQTKPSDMALMPSWKIQATYEHRVYLKLEQALEPGQTIRVTAPNSLPENRVWEPAPCPGEFGTDVAETVTVQFTARPDLRSPAVQVNHLGFRPDDPLKIGFVGIWLGTGGAYDLGARKFAIRTYASGEAVISGRTVKVASDRSVESDNGKNFTGTHLYACDFSELETPGTYILVVDGVGSSLPFSIARDVWSEPIRTVMKGFLAQRSGIELGPPHTTYRRPRPFHPHDGSVIYQSTTPIMDSGNGLNALRTDKDNFGNLVAGKTDEVLGDYAWGGYFDAGDWDRRIQHLEASRHMLELYELFPEKLQSVQFGLPESGNGLPDILNEALFNIDFYRRMQVAAGGIRGGIESEEHPVWGERSWQESLTVLAYAPGVWSSYLYAATAAQAVPLLRDYEVSRAEELLDSAERAWSWAEKELPVLESERDSLPADVYHSRTLAALHLFRATGNKSYHGSFLAAHPLAETDAELHGGRREEAAFYYAHLTQNAEPAVKANARAALLKSADSILKNSARNGYGWSTKQQNNYVGWGNSTAIPLDTLARAHALTGDSRYLAGLIRTAQFGAGANPFNTCLTTGIGHKWPQHPLVCDTHQSDNPPAGISLYGPIEPANYNPWFLKSLEKSVAPDYRDWPTVNIFWDMWWFVPANEFTVMQTMGPVIYGWGYMACR